MYPIKSFDQDSSRDIFGNFPQPETVPWLNAKEQEYLDKLLKIDLTSLVCVYSHVEQQCKDLGQEIFDHFKAEANGDSIAGGEALLNITSAIAHLERRSSISRAWIGVGDYNWRWET